MYTHITCIHIINAKHALIHPLASVKLEFLATSFRAWACAEKGKGTSPNLAHASLSRFGACILGLLWMQHVFLFAS